MINMNVPLHAVVPLLILISLGFLSRKINILKDGDERVLSSYVYYFALPSLFFVSISETKFTREMLLSASSGIIPIAILVTIYFIIYKILRLKRDYFYLLSLSTSFGSLAFFGIPFVIFAFPDSEIFATFQASIISIFSVSLSIFLLEIYSTKEKFSKVIKKVIRRLSRNPLIISIIISLFFSIANISLPTLLETSLHMLGRSASVVAIFMLGVFLYGREYKNLKFAFGLSLLRMLLLPFITLLLANYLVHDDMRISITVLMNAMPMAVSMMVLSNRYKFYENVISSVILISSLGAMIYLNLWLFLLELF